MLERLQHNWPLKLLSLALAYAIWFSVIDESRLVRDFTVPVELQLSDSQAAASEIPITANVRLEGTETGIRRADRVGMELAIDASTLAPGQHEIVLTRSNLSGIPSDLDLRFINPERIQLTLTPKVRRQLPVEPTLLGKPADGYTLYSADVTPKFLFVEGPDTAVNSMTLLRTNPIRLDGRTAPFTVSAITTPESPHARVVGDPSIRVEIAVDQTPIERRFQNVPVILSGSSGKLDYSPKTVNVTLSGPPSLLDTLAPELLRAVADVGGLDPGGGAKQVPITVDFLQVPLEDLERVTVNAYSTRQITVRRLEADSQ